MDRIKEAIVEHWGERCPDFEGSCPTCQAWEEYDDMGKSWIIRAHADHINDLAEENIRLLRLLHKIFDNWDAWQSDVKRSEGFTDLFESICEAKAALEEEE